MRDKLFLEIRQRNLITSRFGKLIVLDIYDPVPYVIKSGFRKGKIKLIIKALCKCDCGKIKKFKINELTRKSGSRSCGCTEKVRVSAPIGVHPQT